MLHYEVTLEASGGVLISPVKDEQHSCISHLPNDGQKYREAIAYRAPCCGQWWKIKITYSDYSSYARWVKISRFRMWRLKRKGVISSGPRTN